MICKTFEVRDAGTFMPVLAVQLIPGCEEDRFLIARGGFGTRPVAQAGYVLVYAMELDEAHYDPCRWTSKARTMPSAHEYIINNFDGLPSGAVIDVQVIIGETFTPKVSERLASMF